MTPEQRKAVQQWVQLSLRQRATREVDAALADGELVREVTSHLNIPDDLELRNLIASAGNPIRLELQNAQRRQTARNFWEASSHRMFVIVPLLAIVLGVGAGLRLDRIGEQSQWLDEYWAVYLATGRGNLIFDIPYGRIVQSPPACGFTGAPAMWHIWTGITSVIHPPLYYMTLRGWIDLFGDGDVATRMMSVAFSLGAIVLMFDAVRRSSGSTGQALAAAAMMALAPAQIDYSQTTRPYTMIEFLALLSVDLLFLIQAKGPSRRRAAALFAAFAATALTHYFTAGFFAGVGRFCVLGLRGKTRRVAILLLIAAFVFVLAAWAPMFWRTRGLMSVVNGDEQGKGFGVIYLFFNLPRRLLLHMSMETGFLAMWGMALLVYVTPLLRLRRYPQLLLWWLWAICAAGFLLVWDEIHQTHLISVTRYVLVASPAIFAILATPLPTMIGKFVPGAFVIAAAAAGFARWQAGPLPNPDIRAAAQLVMRNVPASEPIVIFADDYAGEPAFDYFAIAHYAGPWNHPVVLLQTPASEKLQAKLAEYAATWIWCRGETTARKAMPGWKVQQAQHASDFYLVKMLPVR